MPITEELHTLVARAQTRDASAISELYDRYAGLVLRYLSLRLAEHELAQDLTQEVFIKIINSIERFEYRDEKAFLGWLYTIAANVMYTHQRRRRVRSTPFEAGEELIDQRSQNDAHMITDRVALQQAIEQLTHDQQQVLVLRFFADLSNSEIARLLRRTEGAVKAIQHRALQSLHKILNHEADEPVRQRGHRFSSDRRKPMPTLLAERSVGGALVYSEQTSALEAPGGN